MGPAGLPGRATARMALRASRHGLGGDDQSAQGVARRIAEALLADRARTGSETGGARHDAEVPVAAERPFADRKRAHPGQPGALRRGERPPYALRLHPGRLRLRLQILRQRARRLETEPARRGNRRARCWPSSAGTRTKSKVQSPKSKVQSHGAGAGSRPRIHVSRITHRPTLNPQPSTLNLAS